MMVADTHEPVTLSSKPSAQAKQMLPLGSQSLQLFGQNTELAATSSRVTKKIAFMSFFDDYIGFHCDSK